jgi:hypothetical protein
MAGRGWRISAAPELKSFGAVFHFRSQRDGYIFCLTNKKPRRRIFPGLFSFRFVTELRL